MEHKLLIFYFNPFHLYITLSYKFRELCNTCSRIFTPCRTGEISNVI